MPSLRIDLSHTELNAVLAGLRLLWDGLEAGTVSPTDDDIGVIPTGDGNDPAIESDKIIPLFDRFVRAGIDAT